MNLGGHCAATGVDSADVESEAINMKGKKSSKDGPGQYCGEPVQSQNNAATLDEIASKVSALGGSVRSLIAKGTHRPFDEAVELGAAGTWLDMARMAVLRANDESNESPTGGEVICPADSASSFLPQISELREAIRQAVVSGAVRNEGALQHMCSALRNLDYADGSVRAAYHMPESPATLIPAKVPQSLKLSADATDVIELEARISGLRSRATSLKDDIEATQVRFLRLIERAGR